MADTDTVINQGDTSAPTEEPKGEPRTFTQEELDKYVKTRVGKERDKFADYDLLKEKAVKFDEMEEANKSELQSAVDRADELEAKLNKLTEENNQREMKQKIANESGVPIGLLTGATEEECRAQAESILAFAKPHGGYPSIKDGGEAHKGAMRTTGDQFADWFSKQIK